MLETIVLLLLAPLVAIGTVTLGTITGSYVFKKEEKRKEKFEQDVRKVLFKMLDELKEEENAKV